MKENVKPYFYDHQLIMYGVGSTFGLICYASSCFYLSGSKYKWNVSMIETFMTQFHSMKHLAYKVW